MDKIDFNKFAHDVHENAKEHGFWEGDRDDEEVITLIHSEWSEALEASRKGEDWVWYQCGTENSDCTCVEVNCGVYINGTCDLGKQGAKPEGIAVELIDGCIRILDACAAWGVPIKQGHLYFTQEFIAQQSIPWLVGYLHYETSCIFQQGFYGGQQIHTSKEHLTEHFSRMLSTVWVFLESRKLDPDAIMLEKHEYNKHRPYKHGKKF